MKKLVQKKRVLSCFERKDNDGTIRKYSIGETDTAEKTARVKLHIQWY
jgi:hypothetical protein